jgi:hypothetical protein
MGNGRELRVPSASSLTTNEAGDVWLGAIAAGATTDLLIASYDATGVPGINVRYDSGNDDVLGGEKRSLSVDSGGNLYVAANEALLRFDQHGALAWRAEQLSYAVVADAAGRALVTTPRKPDGQTARFTPDGHRDFLVTRGGSSLAETPSGQIWIGGTLVTNNASGWDLLTTLLAPDGQVVFTDRYDGGDQDRFVDLGVDEDGAAYMLASSYVRSGLFGTADRYLILKYTAAERRVWTEIYGDSGLPKALGVTTDGRFVATGHDGTASWLQGEAKECEWWWPGCW